MVRAQESTPLPPSYSTYRTFPSSYSSLAPFFDSVLGLKSVKRAGWAAKVGIRDGESVADHTFSACAIAMLLSDMMELDTQRVMKMTILHDLAESLVGDYMPGDVTARQKAAGERRAMKKILAGLPEKARREYEEIWLEYLRNRTPAARLVHRVDKLEMALQADRYARQGHPPELLEQFFKSAQAAVGTGDDAVGRILKSIKPPVQDKSR